MNEQSQLFEEFCNDRQINYFRVAFWHYCQAHGTKETAEALATAWDAFLTQALAAMTK